MDREMCKECLRPRATEQDYEDIAEGEGEHLCWGDWSEIQCSSVAQEVTDNARELCVKLQEENERLKSILVDLRNLPACCDMGCGYTLQWDGGTLRCSLCGWDGLADDSA